MEESRICQNCKNTFVIEAQDFDFYKKIDVPPPTFCPECRLQRRLAYRNEKSLYRRKCDKCQKSIISVFSEDSGLTVYCSPCWWSDDWDSMQYGVDYDSSRPFLTQLQDLLKKVPVMALFAYYTTLENSDYTNMVGYLKNCYLVTNSDHSEDCSYGSDLTNSKESIDNAMLHQGELCYETENCRECYRTIYSLDCESCSDVAFSKNCIGCSDLIGCVNLRNKKYCIFNEQYSKEEYQKLKTEYLKNSYVHLKELKEKAHAFWNEFPQKYMHERRNMNVAGDYFYNSKNVKNSFIVTGAEDSRYCSLLTVPKVTNSYDFTHYGENCDLVYDTMQAGNQVARINFSWFAVSNSQNIEYGIFVVGSKNIFGSVSLRNKEYSILNKQYSKEDFEALREEIITEMNSRPYKDAKGNEYRYGEFFPTEMSPFGYNATTAQEHFSLTRDKVLEQGYKWKDPEKGEYAITLLPEKIPDSSEKISDSVTKEVFGCEHQGACVHQCSSAFRITPSELAFYRRMNLPLPRLCSNCRHFIRMELRNPFKLWNRQCVCDYKNYRNTVKHPHHPEGQCPNVFETSYAPDRPEIVYCEQCYNAEVV